ncbi:hypothetical protein V6M85_14110 (plasmid) [Sulfolobus tengchongensis]|uniref:Uncharacterized protein n=1 Tax=Sulfolobus tengchongensis TaxID=207809 RepID=A0AAX4KZT8_9CREN
MSTPNIPNLSSSNLASTVIHYLVVFYDYLVNGIAHFLQVTIFTQDPTIATEYASLIAWLIPLTAIYLILSFMTALKKIIGYFLLAGWGFLLIMLILAKVG